MATTFNEIQEMLVRIGIKYQVKEADGYIVTGYTTEVYCDDEGEKGVLIIIAVDDDGRFVKIFAPNLYLSKQEKYELAILKTCMQINQRIKMIQCEYDHSDGELRIVVDIPLEDSTLSERQFMRAMSCIIETVDTFDSAFRSAVEYGACTVDQILNATLKKAKLERLIQEASAENLDHLIQQLEFANSASQSTALHVVRY